MSFTTRVGHSSRPRPTVTSLSQDMSVWPFVTDSWQDAYPPATVTDVWQDVYPRPSLAGVYNRDVTQWPTVTNYYQAPAPQQTVSVIVAEPSPQSTVMKGTLAPSGYVYDPRPDYNRGSFVFDTRPVTHHLWFWLALGGFLAFLIIASTVAWELYRRRNRSQGLPMFHFGKKFGINGEKLVEATAEDYRRHHAGTTGQADPSLTVVKTVSSPTSTDPAAMPPNRPSPAAATTTTKTVS